MANSKEAQLYLQGICRHIYMDYSPLQLFQTVSVDNGLHIQWWSYKIITGPKCSSPIKCIVEEIEEIKTEEKNTKKTTVKGLTEILRTLISFFKSLKISGSLEEGFQHHTGRSAAHYLLRQKLTLSNVKQTKQHTIDIFIRSPKEHRVYRREKQLLDFNINKSIFSLRANNLSIQNNKQRFLGWIHVTFSIYAYMRLTCSVRKASSN